MSQVRGSRYIAKLVIASFLIQTILPAAYAADQIPDAGGPLMDAATNGVPIVHILPPSASGVSHNTYQKFDVGTQGVILNNASGSVNTQLGGTIGGNVLNGGAPASIILNEVTSGAASLMQGQTEIAGANAEFILANPNGISCNGCGFINTSRVSLVTGTPIFNGLNLSSFNINSGNINIGENGLNALSVNELDLLSRSLTASGEIAAQNAYIVTGLNTIDYSTLDTTPTSNGSEKPAIAVDIAQLGGMYANRIYLLATEEGVGVNNQGRLEANGGGLSLDVNGTLINSGLLHSNGATVDANGTIIANATDIENSSGTVLADGLVLMQATNNFNNVNSVVQGDEVRLSSGSNLTSESSLVSGIKDVVLSAGGDVNVVAGHIEAGGDISLLSGQDLDISPLVNIESNTVYGTRTEYVVNTAGGWSVIYTVGGPHIFCSTSTISIANLVPQACSGPKTVAVQVPDGSVTTTTIAENTGALIEAGGNVSLQASNGSITMDAVSMNAEDSISAQAQAVALFGSKDSETVNYFRGGGRSFVRSITHDETLVKGGLYASQDISLLANGDESIAGDAADHQGNIFLTGSDVISDYGHLSILGTGDVDIANDVTRHTTFYEYYKKKKSLFKKKTTHIIQSTELGQIEPALIAASSISIGADNDLSIVASDVIADNNVGLYAGNDLNLLSTGEISHSFNYRKIKKSGVFGSGGFGITIGSKSVTERNTNDQLKQITSSVSSLNGDVYATAGNQYLQLSSEIITPQGSINIAAKEVGINSNNNTQSVLHSLKTRQTGLTIGFTSPLIQAGQSIASVEEARQRTDDPRMQGLALLTEGLTVYNNYESIASVSDAGNPLAILFPTLELTFGTSETSYESLTKSSLPEESILTAGRDINITATGDKLDEQGDISIVGALANADGNVSLKANNDIYLAAAIGQTTSETKQKSSSASIGISYNLVTQAFGGSIGASKSRGFSNGWGTTYFPTELTAKQALTIESGRHTTLKGATVSGDQVTANIGTNFDSTGEAGNLTIASPQDASHYIAKESSSGFNLTVSTGGAALGLSHSDFKLLSDYQSAKEQTAIRAGAGGFDIHVNGHTQLDGGAIASLAPEADNNLTTQTLGFTNLENFEETTGDSISVSLSANADAIFAGSGVGTANVDQSSYGATLAAIAPATVNITNANAQSAYDQQHDLTQQIADAQSNVSYWQSRINTLQTQWPARPIAPTTTQCGFTGCQTVAVTGGYHYYIYLSALNSYNNAVASINSQISAAQTSLNSAQSGLATLEAQPNTGNVLTAISRDPNTAHTPVNSVFDSTKATAELNAGVAITMAFGRAGFKAAGDYSTNKVKEAEAKIKSSTPGSTEWEEATAEKALWVEGGIGRTALHAIVGGLNFGADGAVSATANQLAQPIIDKILADQGVDADSALGNTLKFAAATAIGAGVGGAQGAATTLTADANNRQLHELEITWIKRNAKRYAKNIYLSDNPTTAQIAEAEKLLAEQAFRQVQFGAEGNIDIENFDYQASAFLRTANSFHIALAPDVNFPSTGYTQYFFASPQEKANAQIFLNDALENTEFYQQNELIQPNVSEISQAIDAYNIRHEDDEFIAKSAIVLPVMILAAPLAGPAIGEFMTAALAACTTNLVLCANEAAIEVAGLLEGVPATGVVVSSALVGGKKLLDAKNSLKLAIAESRSVKNSVLNINGKSGIESLTEMQGAVPTRSGFVNASKNNSLGGFDGDFSPEELALVKQIQNGQDSKGELTEALVELVAERQNLTPLSGGKCGGGSNNCFDHVFGTADGKVLVLDSKQIINGSFKLSTTAKNGSQLDPDWIEYTLSRLGANSAAAAAVRAARDSGNLVTGVAGINRTTGKLLITRVTW